jgi:hypothetical protein
MITIDSIHSTKTYGGCLEGVPSIDSLIESAKRKAVKLFGERAFYVIEPTLENGSLPPWQHIVWLTSHEAVNVEDGEEKADGSELVIIYYNNTVQSDHQSYAKIFNENLDEWKGLASNFWY